MLFIKQLPGQAAEYLAQTINDHILLGEKVLWFLSGGSAIAIAAAARKLLVDKDLANLTVTLIDERYGPVGYADSNWQQLQVGGFNFNKLKSVSVLDGSSIEETTKNWQMNLAQELQENNFKIALMGIGPDGHTSGILPHSPALDSQDLAVHYKAPDYQRITTTPRAITQLNEAVISLSDDKKRPLIDKLQQQIPIAEMPAQILKKVPKVIIFNDWIGEKL